MEEILQKIQVNFHAVINGRAEELVRQHNVQLPQITMQMLQKEANTWFPIPGMYGGFSFHIEMRNEGPVLVSESWCRVCGGSGQRHEVTSEGSKLVDEGFV